MHHVNPGRVTRTSTQSVMSRRRTEIDALGNTSLSLFGSVTCNEAGTASNVAALGRLTFSSRPI